MSPKTKLIAKILLTLAGGAVTFVTKQMEEKELNEKIRKEAAKVVAEMLKKEV